MKRILLTTWAAIATIYSYAQTTNNFPPSGSVGIGITNPLPTQHLTIQDDNATIHLQNTSNPGSYFTDIVSSYNAAYPFYINVNNYGRFGTKKLGLVPTTDAAVPFVA